MKYSKKAHQVRNAKVRGQREKQKFGDWAVEQSCIAIGGIEDHANGEDKLPKEESSRRPVKCWGESG